jgi:hypothetical protein
LPPVPTVFVTFGIILGSLVDPPNTRFYNTLQPICKFSHCLSKLRFLMCFLYNFSNYFQMFLMFLYCIPCRFFFKFAKIMDAFTRIAYVVVLLLGLVGFRVA